MQKTMNGQNFSLSWELGEACDTDLVNDSSPNIQVQNWKQINFKFSFRTPFVEQLRACIDRKASHKT